MLPRFDIISLIWADCIAPAVVTFALSISLAKLFAKRNGYKIDATQVSAELIYFIWPRRHAIDARKSAYIFYACIRNLTLTGILRLRGDEFIRFFLSMHQRWTIDGQIVSVRTFWWQDSSKQYHNKNKTSMLKFIFFTLAMRFGRCCRWNYRHFTYCTVYGNVAFGKLCTIVSVANRIRVRY